MGPLLSELVLTRNFSFMPESFEPTVRLQNFTVVDDSGNLVSLDALRKRSVFISGKVTSWDGACAPIEISNVSIREW